MYQLYRLRELGLRVRVFERGTDIGGTWYWNRYPGARFDSESYSYGYSFSQELLDEWDWSERFASQPEILRYLQYVADKFDLRRDIQFSSDVKSADFDDDARCWEVRLADGSSYTSRFLITGVGILSQPTLPKIEGIGDFKGQSFHTSRWPHTSRGFRWQAGGSYWHRSYGYTDDPRSCQECRAPHRVPATTGVVRSPAQLEDRA